MAKIPKMCLKKAKRPQKKPKKIIREGQEDIDRRTTYTWKEQKKTVRNKIDTDSHNRTEICFVSR